MIQKEIRPEDRSPLRASFCGCTWISQVTFPRSNVSLSIGSELSTGSKPGLRKIPRPESRTRSSNRSVISGRSRDVK